MEQSTATEPIGERIMTRRKLRGLGTHRAAELAERRRSGPEPAAASARGPAEPSPSSSTHDLPESR